MHFYEIKDAVSTAIAERYPILEGLRQDRTALTETAIAVQRRVENDGEELVVAIDAELKARAELERGLE